MVMMAIAAALGLQEFDRGSIDDIVASALGMADVLLVLDNFEHVMDAAPALTRMLSRCPQLKILVTSRSLLRVEGEHAIPVPPLVLPEARATMTHEDWLQVPVITLFIERARPSIHCLPGTRQTSRAWSRCASAWMVCRWPSNWPRPGSVTLPW